MTTQRNGTTRASSGAEIGRLALGIIWLLGAVYNALVTTRMSDAYGWLKDSPVPVYRLFFRDVVDVHPVFWTVLLVVFEFALGVLTLARGNWAKLGLIGGTVFSLFLFSLGSIYTVVMAPYALLLAWLVRRDYPDSSIGWMREVLGRHGGDRNRFHV